jgi:hypothetical protein
LLFCKGVLKEAEISLEVALHVWRTVLVFDVKITVVGTDSSFIYSVLIAIYDDVEVTGSSLIRTAVSYFILLQTWFGLL